MLKLYLLIFFLFNLTFAAWEPMKNPTIFYSDPNDNIEELNATTFGNTVLNSNKVTIMEYYAKWCVLSQWFQVVWTDVANQTRLWHQHVLRVGGMFVSISLKSLYT